MTGDDRMTREQKKKLDAWLVQDEAVERAIAEFQTGGAASELTENRPNPLLNDARRVHDARAREGFSVHDLTGDGRHARVVLRALVIERNELERRAYRRGVYHGRRQMAIWWLAFSLIVLAVNLLDYLT